MEASVESLHEVSGIDTSEIWLYSVELFFKEMAKHNLRLAAAKTEQERMMKEAEQAAKLKKKSVH